MLVQHLEPREFKVETAQYAKLLQQKQHESDEEMEGSSGYLYIEGWRNEVKDQIDSLVSPEAIPMMKTCVQETSYVSASRRNHKENQDRGNEEDTQSLISDKILHRRPSNLPSGIL